jgi:hypothetical protein
MDGLFAALFASGRIVDAILLLVAGEALVLAWLRRRGALGGRALAPLLANLASGAALMLALRGALTGAAWTGTAAWLLAGLVAHLADLGLRLRTGGTAQRRSPPPSGTTPRTVAFTRVTPLKEL